MRVVLSSIGLLVILAGTALVLYLLADVAGALL